mmetsp:Transcript_46317/g.140307  ORF Transcript_46317/g.140307 Transcript_46317/m.140307 type:complete len:655 (-) Transcript_46317:301-2265(-)
MEATSVGNANGSNESDLRSRYDMEQALAMRRAALSRRTRSQSPLPTSGSSSPPINIAAAEDAALNAALARDVDLALSGLESAEHLAASHGDIAQWEEAKKLYEMSIERLIKFLNTSKGRNIKISGVISKDFVAERVRCALTEAEELKGRIKAAEAAGRSGTAGNKLPSENANKREDRRRLAGVGDEANHNSAGSTGSGGWGVSSVASAMSSAFKGTRGGGRSSSFLGEVESKPKPKPRPKPKLRPDGTGSGSVAPSYAAATASSTRRTGGAATSAAASAAYPPRRRPRTDPTATAAVAATTTTRRRCRTPHLDYVTDPLVSAIKSDLYVDSSTITTSWGDIAGLREAKQSMQEAAILPLLRPDLYTGLRTAPRGILLYGPPGTGKTMLVKAVAKESCCVLFAATSSSLTSKWHGEGEKLVRTLFRMALDVAPSILFFDELDALLSRRKDDEHEASRRFKTEFMVQMDGIVASGGSSGKRSSFEAGPASSEEDDEVSRRVLVLGCTNCPWDVDDAVLRRFSRRIYVPLPDAEARRYVIEGMLRKADEGAANAGGKGKGHTLSSRQITKLVSMTEGFSCSDLTSVGQEAAFGPLRELGGMERLREVESSDVRPLHMGDFEGVLSKGGGKRSVSRVTLERYGKWEREQSGATSSGLR